jgi:hypothetical protein
VVLKIGPQLHCASSDQEQFKFLELSGTETVTLFLWIRGLEEPAACMLPLQQLAKSLFL